MKSRDGPISNLYWPKYSIKFYDCDTVARQR